MSNIADGNVAPVKRGITAVLVWLVISQILYLLSLSPWYLLAQMTGMLFDLGTSTAAELIAGLVWVYPLLPLVCSLLAWFLYARRKNMSAAVVTSLPLLGAVPIALIAAVLTI